LDSKNVNDLEETTEKKFSLLDLVFIFVKYKKRILFSTLIICIVSVIFYFFVFDLIYMSNASIKSTKKASSLLGGIELPELGGFEDFGLGGGATTKELGAYEEVLKSRRCIEPLVVKFGQMEREDFRFMEDAIKDFRDTKLFINIDKISGVMNVGVYDKDPVVAKEMVEFLLEELNKIYTEMNVYNAKFNREFIEKRYFQAREDLSKAEDTLKSYQVIYGIAPDIQVKASAQTAFTIEAELKAEEVKLDVLKKILSSDQPEVKTQEAKVNSLRSKVVEIQNSTDITDLIKLGNSPQIIMGYLRLQREVEIQAKILTFMLPIYEQAKIEEKRDTPSIIILDKPYVAERKTKPKRLTMVLILTFVGFVFSLAVASMFEYFQIQKTRNSDVYVRISGLFKK
jgi:tyrosine-protein kinase Etk/Wzc